MANKELPEYKIDAKQAPIHNPHPDFKSVEASRSDWDESRGGFRITKTRAPEWQLGDGANDGGESLQKEHVAIDPYEEGRAAVHNYKLLISAIVPRPIGFIGTRSKDGSTTNLSPYSYTQVFNHDPPIFCVGFAGSLAKAKDSLKNLLETEECTLNIISEHFLEAANSTSINAPYGTSEWALSGLTAAPCTYVSCSRVKEAVFSVECKLLSKTEYASRADPSRKTGVIATLEGVRFWAREDAINGDRNLIDPSVLRPIARLGGITYARVTEGVEIPRPVYEEMVEKGGKTELAKPKAEGQ